MSIKSTQSPTLLPRATREPVRVFGKEIPFLKKTVYKTPTKKNNIAPFQRLTEEQRAEVKEKYATEYKARRAKHLSYLKADAGHACAMAPNKKAAVEQCIGQLKNMIGQHNMRAGACYKGPDGYLYVPVHYGNETEPAACLVLDASEKQEPRLFGLLPPKRYATAQFIDWGFYPNAK